MKLRSCSKLISLFLLFGVFFLISSSFGGLGFAKDGADLVRDKEPGEILVKFKTGVTSAQAQSVHSKFGGQVKDKIARIGVHRVKVPEGTDIAEKIRQYEQDARVENAEPNYVRRACATPNDPGFSNQWNMVKIKGPEAWDIETGNSNVVKIAIIDTGVDLDHPDLVGKIVAGYDFVNNDNSPQDDNGHGTHVAGIAAAVTNNSTGVAGVSWGAQIMPIKVLDDQGNGTDFDVMQGIYYAIDNGARVINMSLGGYDYNPFYQTVINDAHSAGVVVAAAAGNDDTSTPLYPAACNYVIGVSATDQDDYITSYSNYGSYIDVAAPGGEWPVFGGLFIYSTVWNDDYAWSLGTSMATPHVTGLAALLASRYPSLTNDDIEERIRLTADDVGASGRDHYYGDGRINALKALSATHLNGALIKTSSSASVYFLDRGERKALSFATFVSHGFRWDRIETIASSEMATYQEGQALKARPGTLLKGSTPSVYVTDFDGTNYLKRGITSPTVFNSLGYRWEDIITVPDAELNTYTDGALVSDTSSHPNGTLIKTSSAASVYLLEKQKGRAISFATFVSHGFRWDRIETIASSEMATYSSPDSDLKARPGTLLKGSTPSVYVTDFDGTNYLKRGITSPTVFNSLGYRWEDIITVPDAELNTYTTGTPVTLSAGGGG